MLWCRQSRFLHSRGKSKDEWWQKALLISKTRKNGFYIRKWYLVRIVVYPSKSMLTIIFAVKLWCKVLPTRILYWIYFILSNICASCILHNLKINHHRCTFNTYSTLFYLTNTNWLKSSVHRINAYFFEKKIISHFITPRANSCYNLNLNIFMFTRYCQLSYNIEYCMSCFYNILGADIHFILPLILFLTVLHTNNFYKILQYSLSSKEFKRSAFFKKLLKVAKFQKRSIHHEL